MKKFLVNCSVFLGVVLVLAAIMDAMISSGLRKSGLRKYAVWSEISQGGLHSDLLIIGSSRAWCSYNTYILDSTLGCDSYNLGIDGHAIDYQMLRYNTYRRFNPRPKYVLVNIDCLSTFMISSAPEYEREQFFPFVRDRILMSQVAKAKRLTWVDRFLPLVRYVGYRVDFEGGMKAFFGKTDFPDAEMHKGFRGNNYGWSKGEIVSKDTLVSVDIYPEKVKLLDSVSKRFIDAGVRVVFVKAPFYAPVFSKIKNIGETDSIFDVISKKYDIPILDYYETGCCLDSTYFYNPSHLNKKGSEWFTRELCRDLEALGIYSK